jgi:hypothetical protein
MENNAQQHPNEFMQALKSNYKHYIDILAENQDSILAVPPDNFFRKQNASIDEIAITEHILQLSFDGKEMTSLNGKTYKVIGENQLCSATGDERLSVNILSRDITYADN